MILKGRKLILQGSTYTINSPTNTSAGVYKSDGTLVRTLWSGMQKNAGTYTISWDGNDDFGNPVTGDTYHAEVVSGAPTYTWEGARIGNTSTAQTGSTKFHGFDIMNTLCITGNTAYYGLGYSENDTAQGKFSLSDINSKIPILYQYHATSQSTFYSCTDGINVYWSGADFSGWFTFATKVSDDSEVSFANGVARQTAWGRQYISVGDVIEGDAGYILGSAVQKNGIYLFVAHIGNNTISVLNKSTMALVRTITGFTSPRQLCIDSDDNLWIISDTNTVSKYTVNSDGTLSSVTKTLTGLVDPRAIGINSDGSTLILADGGTSQQIKGFVSGATSPTWTYGTLGGYMNDATVQNDKFYFSDIASNIRLPFICFQSDNSFWVSDPGNYRVQHFDTNRTFLNRVMFLPHSYNVYADKNNPTRVFNECLEFAVDYSKPLDNGSNGSWTLVKNWRGAAPADSFTLRSVMTLNNGRTYGLLTDMANSQIPYVVELPTTGVLRLTGKDLGNYGSGRIMQDGSLRSMYTYSGSSHWYKEVLTGFDASNNPIWAAGIETASTDETSANDPVHGGHFAPPANAVTSSNIIISFSGGIKDGYHLGGVKEGSNKYLWKTAMTVAGGTANTSDFPRDGRFDIGNEIARPGTMALAIDNSVIWGYGGEFWRGYQCNIFNHVWDNGLFIGQFGTLGVEHYGEDSPAQMAGNSFTLEIVKVGSDYYLYHNDEFFHSGVHRWKISGLGAITKQVLSIS
jgi:YVTN family beta-propeller protein